MFLEMLRRILKRFTSEKNGMMIAGIGGGIGFLAICVIVGVAIYRRMKKGSQVRVSSSDNV